MKTVCKILVPERPQDRDSSIIHAPQPREGYTIIILIANLFTW
jgi:hypothetical protein